MRTGVAQSGPLPDARPRPLQSDQAPADAAARDHVGVGLQTWRSGQHGARRRPKGDQLGARLGVGQAEAGSLEVDLRPAEVRRSICRRALSVLR
jgi:hypothetical protein